jgi:adenylyltransferase/sulfurtransferase
VLYSGVPVSIQLPAVLREHTDGLAELNADAADVASALRELTRWYPRLQRHLFSDGGELRAYVNVYVNQDEVRNLPEGMSTPLRNGDVVVILPSVAGG